MQPVKFALSKVAEVFNGKTPAKAEHRDVGHPVLKIKDVTTEGQFAGRFSTHVDPVLADESRGKFLQENDILILNAAHNASHVASKIWLATANVAGALPTGEWLVIRADALKVLPEYLYYWLHTGDGKSKLRFLVKGIHLYPKDVAQIEVPSCSLEEQRRIVDILKRADSIRRLRKQAIQTARELIPALFVDMFGDPATNPKGWERVPFSTVGTLDRGKSKHRPRNDPLLFGGPHPFIQTGDVANSGGRIRNYRSTYSEQGLSQSRLWPKGTLCITIAANIAETGVLEFDACFPDSVVGFLPGPRVTTDYVQAWLTFLQPTLEANAPQLAQKNINLKILGELPIPIPPIALQQDFSRRRESVESVIGMQNASSQQSDVAFQSLLHRAFSGELATSPIELQIVDQVKSVKHSRGIFYRRAAIDAYLIHSLADDKNLGRTKIEKITHLLEYHCGLDLEREPIRDAAGPNDYVSRRKVESLAAKQHWYSASQASERWGVRYEAGANITSALPIAKRIFGKHQSVVDGLIALMRPLDTKQCEIAATLYAAWNDLLLASPNPTDDEIITEVHDNWHPSKKTIPVDRWMKGLRWLRQSGLVPRGVGKPVRQVP